MYRATPPERGAESLVDPLEGFRPAPEVIEQGVDFFLEDDEALSEKIPNFT